LEFCRFPGTLQVEHANLKLHRYKVFYSNLIVYLLQSGSVSALLISAYPAAMFLVSALRSVKIPCSGHVDFPQISGKASDWTVLCLNNI
jgi:hypothetical protein